MKPPYDFQRKVFPVKQSQTGAMLLCAAIVFGLTFYGLYQWGNMG